MLTSHCKVKLPLSAKVSVLTVKTFLMELQVLPQLATTVLEMLLSLLLLAAHWLATSTRIPRIRASVPTLLLLAFLVPPAEPVSDLLVAPVVTMARVLLLQVLV